MSMEQNILIRGTGLRQWFPVKRSFWEPKLFVKAVDGVDITVHEGETFGIAGESGCGKSTLLRTLLRVVEPTAGTIEFAGQDITHLPNRQLRPLRRDMQMVFQDPYSSLDGNMRVGAIIEEPMVINKLYGSHEERLRRVQELSNYWADVRLRYESFDHGLKASTTDIYRYEIPGGQYTNLRPQVESLGLGDRFEEVKEMYETVNDMLGDPVKVTPSSKVVGDLAIFMVQNDLTPENIVRRGEALAFPDSVVSYFKGMMGQPAWGFPKELQKVVLKGEEPITCRPGKLLPPVDFDKLRHEVEQFRDDPEKKDLISYAMYPKVYEDFCRHRKEYGYITRMGSHVFFNGMALGETNKINIEDGKTLVIKYLGLGDRNNDGTINVQFELNGMRREVTVRDPHASEETRQATLADESDPMQVGTSIPGMVSKLSVKQGDHVEKDQVLAVIEAMKMETAITARAAGTVKTVRVMEGQPVKAKELLMVLE